MNLIWTRITTQNQYYNHKSITSGTVSNQTQYTIWIWGWKITGIKTTGKWYSENHIHWMRTKKQDYMSLNGIINYRSTATLLHYYR